jgi:hypothetical protein
LKRRWDRVFQLPRNETIHGWLTNLTAIEKNAGQREELTFHPGGAMEAGELEPGVSGSFGHSLA